MERFRPWAGGVGGVRMGLQPIAADAWLVEPADFAERLTEKQALYRTRFAEVYGELPIASAAASEAARLLTAGATASRGQPREPNEATLMAGLAPLALSALGVAEDVCVLVPQAGEMVLVAASLCAPSHWRLAEKLGRPMHIVHAPVAELQQRIGADIARFLERLPVGRIFQRGNWHLHPDNRRFVPEPGGWAMRGVVDTVTLASFFVRTERQTLRRLPDSGGVLFTILVDHVSLAELTTDDLRDLRRAYAAMSEAERNERGWAVFGAAFEDYVVARLAALD